MITRQRVAESVRGIFPNDVDALMTATAPELFQYHQTFTKTAMFSIYPDVTARLLCAAAVAYCCAKLADGHALEPREIDRLRDRLKYHGITLD